MSAMMGANLLVAESAQQHLYAATLIALLVAVGLACRNILFPKAYRWVQR